MTVEERARNIYTAIHNMLPWQEAVNVIALHLTADRKAAIEGETRAIFPVMLRGVEHTVDQSLHSLDEAINGENASESLRKILLFAISLTQRDLTRGGLPFGPFERDLFESNLQLLVGMLSANMRAPHS
jgi:hypothetical protein